MENGEETTTGGKRVSIKRHLYNTNHAEQLFIRELRRIIASSVVTITNPLFKHGFSSYLVLYSPPNHAESLRENERKSTTFIANHLRSTTTPLHVISGIVSCHPSDAILAYFYWSTCDFETSFASHLHCLNTHIT